MSLLTILEFPDPRLRKKAVTVTVVDDALRRTIDDMFETMYAAPGIGLAATQVNVHLRLVVIDVSPDGSEPLCLINPEILEAEGQESSQEGCLSVPGYYEEVCRPRRIRVKALNRNGQPFELVAEDLMAVCLQHEVDHLDGKLFVDYLSTLKRQRIKNKLLKEQRQPADI